MGWVGRPKAPQNASGRAIKNESEFERQVLIPPAAGEVHLSVSFFFGGEIINLPSW